ncbi:hypothetical protein [Plastoroseomonas arctica]|uniref:PrsW family intramembrane metalloprotease n=1 Tax=Plastoroseomonas arctica TaxID=1509237 RepID=A0AAF1KHX7_9PROT|nr:hypothetical protein [Plastoroseomonas arctica]MBR0654449.1 hypothetical protein [Plastoroseomonas arctica]
MIPGIAIAALITAALALLLVGAGLWRMTQPADRGRLALGFALALPLQPGAFWLVRMPLHHALVGALGTEGVMAWLPILYAPVTEEAAKWAVLLAVFRGVRPTLALPAALAIGLGFGIGEIGFLAERLARSPAMAALPFWMFGGFLGERISVCIMHGLFITPLAFALAHGRGAVLAGLAGMGAHLALNAPILLIGAAPFGVPAEVWQGLVSLWLALMLVAGLAWAIAAHRGAGGRSPLGESDCPECGKRYPRPLLAANLGAWRYERCPCRKWHRVRA